MNYTEKYHLPQWKKEDRIMMEDFNNAMSNIDSGLAAVKDGAAQNAAELSQRVDAVKQIAEDAKQKAYTPPFVTGHYVGLDKTTTFTVGFRPTMVIIWGDQPDDKSSTPGRYSGVVVETPTHVWLGMVEFTDTGFTVKKNDPKYYPKLVDYAHYYVYVAFR